MISESLEAIEAMHFAAALGNPVATPIVRTTTAASTIEAPRSWTKDEKLLFTGLPPEIQTVIVRRENDRERVMRRAQNELAELKKRLQADAEIKSADIKKETTDADPRGTIQPQG
jgi:hypothetical protein